MAIQQRYNPQLLEGTDAEFNETDHIYDENDLLLTSDTNILKKGNGIDLYPELSPIGGGGGGTPQQLQKGDQVGEIGITQGNTIIINTIAADGIFDGNAGEIDLGGTGAEIFDMNGATGIPFGGQGLLVHFQRQGGDGNGEFQLFSSDEQTNPGIYARWKLSGDPGDYGLWGRMLVIQDLNDDNIETNIINSSGDSQQVNLSAGMLNYGNRIFELEGRTELVTQPASPNLTPGEPATTDDINDLKAILRSAGIIAQP